MCDYLRSQNPNIDISAQALQQRMNSCSAVILMYKVLQKTIKTHTERRMEQIPKSTLFFAKRILVEDSTSFSLNSKLKNVFKGKGGNSSEAAVKIDYIYELRENKPVKLSLYNGTDQDRKRSCWILPDIKPGDLVLRDLGYTSVNAFQGINAKKAFYISRMSYKTYNTYLPDQPDSAIDIIDYVNKHFEHQNVIDLDILLQSDIKMPTRIVIYRFPPEVVERNIRKYKQKATRLGTKLKYDMVKRLSFGLYITNIDRNILEAGMIDNVYRLRWQIELVFKNWKSLFHINALKGQNENRIRCLLYGRLIAIFLLQLIYARLVYISEKHFNHEMSEAKFIKYMKRNGRFRQIIDSDNINHLFEKIIGDFRRYLWKQKRKRKTTKEFIIEKILYNERYYLNSDFEKHIG